MNDPDIFKERKEKCVSTPYGEVCFNHDPCTAFGYQCLLSSDNFTSVLTMLKFNFSHKNYYENVG